MDEINKIIKEIEEELKEQVKVIEKKTGKNVVFNVGFNTHDNFIKINNKKISFKMTGALRTYIDGMYQIAKDL